ncbi:hypothetical protein [Agrococcus beijingensis]|uniref:hypothetical protein n=1 Tax=Agrococcus beijingensis TaxID=3068634 RepID=UPI0027415D68|nr:hypothetical protein [Agrococcus sp. REN33]
MRGTTGIIVLVAALAVSGCASAPTPPEGFVAGAGIETLPDSAEQVADGYAFAHAAEMLDGGGWQLQPTAPDDEARASWVIRSVCVGDDTVDYVFIPPEQVEQFAALQGDLCPTS